MTTRTEFPRTMVGGVSLPRLLIGTNWFLGYSHTSLAKDKFIDFKTRHDCRRPTPNSYRGTSFAAPRRSVSVGSVRNHRITPNDLGGVQPGTLRQSSTSVRHSATFVPHA
jgi:hypothetical protein